MGFGVYLVLSGGLIYNGTFRRCVSDQAEFDVTLVTLIFHLKVPENGLKIRKNFQELAYCFYVLYVGNSYNIVYNGPCKRE